MTTTTAKRASRSGNPATAADAKRAAAASKKAEIEAEAAARAEEEARRAAAVEAFKAMKLDAPVLDEDGYEVIPDRSTLEGQSYKFKVGGKAYVLPNLQYLPVNLAINSEKMTEGQIHQAIFGRYAPDLMDHASADQLTHIFKRWQDYSKGVGLGE